MLIECILLRDGGTQAEMDGVTYHFAPLPTGEHVAEVGDRDHAVRFLGITEGYRAFIPDNQAALAPGAAAGAAGKGAGALSPGGTGTPDLDAMTRDELVALHEQLEGSKPHHRLGEARLREVLAEILAKG